MKTYHRFLVITNICNHDLMINEHRSSVTIRLMMKFWYITFFICFEILLVISDSYLYVKKHIQISVRKVQDPSQTNISSKTKPCILLMCYLLWTFKQPYVPVLSSQASYVLRLSKLNYHGRCKILEHLLETFPTQQ